MSNFSYDIWTFIDVVSCGVRVSYIEHSSQAYFESDTFPAWICSPATLRAIGASGITWSHLQPSGALWTYPESSGGVWDHLELSGGICSRLELSGAIRNFLEPPGAIWSLLEPSQAIWTHLRVVEGCVTICYHLVWCDPTRFYLMCLILFSSLWCGLIFRGGLSWFSSIRVGPIWFALARFHLMWFESLIRFRSCWYALIWFDLSRCGFIVDAIWFVVIWLGSFVGVHLLGRVIAFGVPGLTLFKDFTFSTYSLIWYAAA